MANSKDNINKYATSFIGFDETSGNVYDSIGGYVGTTTGTMTRVTGWNGEGKAMSFNGTGYISFNNYIIPKNEFTIRFKFKKDAPDGRWGNIFSVRGSTASNKGMVAFLGQNNGILYVSSTGDFNLSSNYNICDGTWKDIMITKDSNSLKLYINDMLKPVSVASFNSPLTHSSNLYIGTDGNLSYSNGFVVCQLDQIEIYDRVISPVSDKHLVIHSGQYKYHNGTSWLATTGAEADFIQYGMNDLSHITEAQWGELQGSKSIAVWSDFEDKQYVSAVLEKDPFTAKDLLGDTPELVYYTNSDKEQVVIKTETEPYSVYEHISEAPQVVIYTESTEDIKVSTTTEAYDLYDEFGDEVEVLFYTDDVAVTEADLILEANWSPVDELEGDFEVATWTDEAPESAQRVLEMTAIPKPQFIKLVNPKRLYGYLDEVLSVDISNSYRDEVRYLLTDSVAKKWYVWDKVNKKFKEVDASTHELITKNGMKYTDLDELQDVDWRTWKGDYMNIGIFLKDNPRDTITSIIDRMKYQDYLPRNTTTVEKASLYILNTTAKIDIELNGNTLKGILSDADLTRVQYRVKLNGQPFYPADGEFTKLGESPQNIELIIGSKDIKIDDWNTLKVEFQDFFGTTDYWSTQFIGTYSGLMFKDVYGQYYSSEIGEVLQYLDFGIIIAGQTTLEHEVILKNQYGYDVENIHLYANKTNFPDGMTLEFSPTQTPFSPNPELKLSRTLANNEEMSFFLRIKTTLGATPDANGSFDIIVKADRIYN